MGYLVFYCSLALGVTAGIAWGYQTLRSHPTFAVDTIEIVGASQRTERDLQVTLQPFKGRNFFTVDLGEVRKQGTAHPWVDTVTVHGHLPRRIKLTVRERIPAGLIRRGNDVLVVSPDGQPIAPVHEMNEAFANATSADSVLDQPILVGVPGDDRAVEVITRGLAALQDIKDTSLLFWGHIETLDLSDERNMIIQLRNVSAPLYLGDEVIPDNIRNYLAIAQYIQKEYPRLEYIELGFPNHIAIMPKEVE